MAEVFIWFFLSLKGRIGRQEFCLGIFAFVVVNKLVVQIGRMLDSGPVYYNVKPPPDVSIVQLLLIVSLWPLAAILVKRLHDFNISGWWGLTILAASPLARAFGIPYWIPYLLIAATLSVIPGRLGSNRFGSDPRRRAGSQHA
ncbi:MAG TPA: DUF805 domain-containing protein [Tardiphaga sp.]